MKKQSIQILGLGFFLMVSFHLNAQNTINSKKGYSPQIGVVVEMLEDLKRRVTRNVQNLDQKQTDFLLDDQANRIGALILHLAATEKYYQVYTFENRGYNRKEAAFWNTPMNLGETARTELVGKPIDCLLYTSDAADD